MGPDSAALAISVAARVSRPVQKSGAASEALRARQASQGELDEDGALRSAVHALMSFHQLSPLRDLSSSGARSPFVAVHADPAAAS